MKKLMAILLSLTLACAAVPPALAEKKRTKPCMCWPIRTALPAA